MKKLVLLLTVMTLSFQANAQKRAFTIPDVYRIQTVSGVRLSPDGTKIAYAKNKTDFKTVTSETNICLMDSDGKNVCSLTEDGGSFSPVWTKDGRGLFFTSYLNGSAQELYRANHGFRAGSGRCGCLARQQSDCLCR